MKKKSRLQLSLFVFLQLLCGLSLHATGLDKAPKIHATTQGAVRVCPGSSLTAELNSARFAQAQVSVQNAAGKVLMHSDVVLDPGKNILRFKVSEIPQGAYFIQVKSENGTEKMTFVVY